MAKKNRKTWLITGCSKGIGRVIAEKVAKHGHNVVATARDADTLSDLATSYPEHVLCLKMDVTHTMQVKKVASQAIHHFGGVDVLVNNAGYGLTGVLEEVTMKQIRAQMETNVFGLMEVTRAVLPAMRENKSGFIFNFSSIAGLRGYRGFGIYNASKFAVNGMSEALAGELAPFGIYVSLVEPGPYRTEWSGQSLDKSTHILDGNTASPYYEINAALAERVAGMDGKQPGKPEQIASVLISIVDRGTEPPMHLLFGDEAIEVWHQKLQDYKDTTYFDTFPHTRLEI